MPNIQFKHAHWIFVALICLGQLQRIELSFLGTQATVYAHDVFIVAYLGYYWLQQCASQKLASLGQIALRVRAYVASHAMLSLWAMWVVLGMTLSLLANHSLTPILYALRALLYVGFGYTLNKIFTNDLDSLRERYMIIGIIIGIVGWLQYLLLPDTRFLSALGWDDHYYRLISTLFDPNFTGMLLVLSWVYAGSLEWLMKKPPIRMAVMVFLAATLGATFSRASFLAFGVAIIFAAFIKKERLVSVVSLIALLAVLLLAPKPTGEGVDLARTSTIESRITTNSAILDTLGKHPTQLIFGTGLFTARSAQTKVDGTSLVIPNNARLPDNLLVLILSSTGVVGLILALMNARPVLMALYSKHGWMFIALLSLLTHAQFNNTVFEPFVLICLIGGLYSSGREPKHRQV